MSKRRYEVKTAVDSVVYDVAPVQTTFIMKVSFKLIVNVLDDCSEAVIWNRGILNMLGGRFYLIISDKKGKKKRRNIWSNYVFHKENSVSK